MCLLSILLQSLNFNDMYRLQQQQFVINTKSKAT